MRKSKRIIIRDSQVARLFLIAASFIGIVHFWARQTDKNITVQVASVFEKRVMEKDGYRFVYRAESHTRDTKDIVMKWKTEWRPGLWSAIRDDPFFEQIQGAS